MVPSSLVTRYCLLILLTIQNTVTVISLRTSMIHTSTSNKNYIVSTLVLTMEMIKLFLLLSMLIIFKMKCSIRKTFALLYDEMLRRPTDTLPLAVPSFLYVVQDNLIIYALACVDVTTYQVTYQARILTTALFARILLKKQLTLQRWLSLVLLMIGVILAQLNFNDKSGNVSFRSENEGSIFFSGLIAIGCASLTSGFAGVYNEKLIKNGHQPSLLIRSIQLSVFCVFFAFMGVVVKDGVTISNLGYFYGYSPFLWLIATIQAIGGIIVAGTMKYADNILKTFATSNSIVLSFVLSDFLLEDHNLKPEFIIGTLIILTATLLYSMSAPVTSSPAEQTNEISLRTQIPSEREEEQKEEKSSVRILGHSSPIILNKLILPSESFLIRAP